MNDETSQPIECRAAVDLPLTATNEILFLPIGLHAITPVSGGIGRPIKVKVGPESAQAIEAQHKALMQKGKRPYFDFNHEDGPASFWPESFVWRQGEGVIAKGEWSRRGKDAVEGKDFRAFSPVFHVDNKRAEAAQVVCKETADPNMGGLVNNPAFKDLPLWAKNAESLGNAGATGENAEIIDLGGGATATLTWSYQQEKQMENAELAALRAKNEELTNEVAALKASAATDDESAKSRLTTAEAELRAVHAEIEVEELRATNAHNEGLLKARNKSEAEAAVKAAIQRGAVLPKDVKTQTALIARATADPSFKDVIAAMQGNSQSLATRITGNNSRFQVENEAPSAIFASIARCLSNTRRVFKQDERRELSLEIAGIYAREMKGSNKERILAFPVSELREAIMAGDVTDTDLGTLSGTLVVQRTLELLKFSFPSLAMFTSDFSSEAARLNQVIMTRTIEVPNVITYNTSTGWSDSDAVTDDVPVTIDKHEGVVITFNENILASTIRRLFDEFAPASAYALAKSIVDNIYSKITDANFTNNSVVALASFTRGSVVDLGTELDLRGVPAALGQRTLLLWPTYFGKLIQDTGVINLAAFQKPQLFTDPSPDGVSLVIPLDAFQVVKAPNLPTNDGNVVGFAASKSALCVATRMPNDYTTWAPGASNGNVQMVTDPDLGISVMLAQYVSHQLGTGTQRISIMHGAAAGQGNAGQLLKAHSGTGSGRVS